VVPFSSEVNSITILIDVVVQPLITQMTMTKLFVTLSLLFLVSVDSFAAIRWHPATARQLNAPLLIPSGLHSTISSISTSSAATSTSLKIKTQHGVLAVNRIDLSEFAVALVRAVIDDTADIVHSVTSALLWIRHPITAFMGALPPSIRFFAQPFLILYLVPLLLIRDLVRPDRQAISQVLLQ
jgi:hypothetical protein